jgi:hypothetical protein
MAVVAALLVLVAGLTLVARASGSSPRPSGSGAGAVQVTKPALSPIQRLVFETGGEGSRRSDRAGSTDGVVRGEGEDGHMADGFCRLNL